MIIELDELLCRSKDKIEINEEIIFDEEYFNSNDIKSLKDVHFVGQIKEDSDDNIRNYLHVFIS